MLELVARNINLMIERRGLVSSLKDVREITAHISQTEYAVITGSNSTVSTDTAAVRLIMVVIDHKSKYATTSGDFRKMITRILQPYIRRVDAYAGIEVRVITSEPITLYIQRIIAALNAEGVDDSVDSTGNNVIAHHQHRSRKYIINYHTYDMFACDIQNSSMVPKHVVVPSDDPEIVEFCSSHYTTPNQFPKILVSDPQAVWIGAQVGDCVRIERRSETAGTAIIYRQCVNA